jgi:hypothetical protein
MRITTVAALLLLAGPAAARAQEPGLYRSDVLPGRGSPELYVDDHQDDRDGYGQQQRLGVRVSLENQRDLFRPGDVSRVLVRATQDAYVAVVHITPDGDVEFLWPNEYQGDGYMRGGAQYAVTSRGGVRGLRIGSGYGIGYVMAVASDEPLDLRGVRDYYYRRSTSWDPSVNVVGDPFRAMERLARLLVPDYDEGYGAVDWYTYHVGSQRYRYPRYACYETYGSWYTSRSSYYDGCDRVRVLLVSAPYYYDTRYYRGDRSRYWRQWYAHDGWYGRRDGYRERYRDGRRSTPQHGYKEGAYGYDRATGSPNRRPFVRSSEAPPPRPRNADSRSGDADQEGTRSTVRPSTRQRPTLERRPAESEPVRVTPSREREREPRSEPRSSERSAEPRRESPPAREPRAEQPRREPAPQRAEPRSQPRAEPRSAPPPRDAGSSGRSAPSERARVAPPQG